MAKKKKSSKNKVSRKKSAKKAIKKKIVKRKSASRESRRASVAPAQIAAPVSAAYRPQANERLLGEVEDYFSRIGVIALTLSDSLSLGDTIHVKGHTTDLTQQVDSMQIEHQPVQNAKKGDSVGIKVNDKCRKGDAVYKLSS